MKKVGIDLTYIRKNEVSGVKKLGEEITQGIYDIAKDKYEIVLFIDENMTEYYSEKFPDIKKIIVQNRAKKINIKYIGKIVRLIDKSVYNKLKQSKCDVIIHPYVTFDSPVGRKINSISSLLDFNPIDIMENKNSYKYKLMEKMYRKLINKTDYISTLSEYSKKRIYEISPSYKGVVEVIPSSIQKITKTDKSITEILNDNKPYIFSINSFFKYKNQITLVKAFNLIKDKIPHNLVLVGRPELNSGMSGYNDVINYIEENNLKDRVKILSFISDEDRNCLFYNTDLFVSTSTQEGFGRTPVEAALCRVPVISSTSTSLKEATLGLVNYYENPLDEVELSNKIIEVLNNKPSENLLDEIAKKLEYEYNEEHIAEKFVKLIEKYLKEKVNE